MLNQVLAVFGTEWYPHGNDDPPRQRFAISNKRKTKFFSGGENKTKRYKHDESLTYRGIERTLMPFTFEFLAGLMMKALVLGFISLVISSGIGFKSGNPFRRTEFKRKVYGPTYDRIDLHNRNQGHHNLFDRNFERDYEANLLAESNVQGIEKHHRYEPRGKTGRKTLASYRYNSFSSINN